MEPTPLEAWDDGVWLKREDVHELGAFKWRGALATLERRREDVVTASTGNHGVATAWAAQRMGVTATVFVPRGASETKLELLRRFRAELHEVEGDFDDAKDAARAFAASRGLFFFEDGDESPQLDGYAGIGEEVVAQLGSPPATVIVPVGNGALLAGVARGLGEEPRVVAVAAENAPVMHDSWRAGRVVESQRSETIADGLAVRVAIPSAVEWLREAVDDFVLVSEAAMERAVAKFWERGIRAEPSAAAALAALPRVVERPAILIVTGRNIDDALLRRCVEHAGGAPIDV